MRKKRMYILLPLLMFALDGKAQHTGFSLLGTWKQTEYLGNDGAKDYTTRIENGPTFTFTQEGTVTDKQNQKGTYTLTGERLWMKFPEATYYYVIYTDGKEAKKMWATPVTPEYQFICDEGCAEVYVKIKD